MADRPVSVPPVDKLERGELLALVMIVSAGRISDLDIATARWEAAIRRSRQRSDEEISRIRDYTDARARFDAAVAEGRSTKVATRALDAARAAYLRAAAAATDADGRSSRRFEDLRRIREGRD